MLKKIGGSTVYNITIESDPSILRPANASVTSKNNYTIKINSLILILLLSCSCSAIKKNNSKIVDIYLNTIIKKEDSLVVIKNKINNNFTIELLKNRSVNELDANTLESSVGLKDSLYKEKYWVKMNDKYNNIITNEIWLSNSFWKKKDFKNKKINFIKQKDFPKPYENNVFFTSEFPEVKVFSFSEPIYYKSKEFAIFAKAETTTKKQYVSPNSIIVMKKEKRKWFFFQVITSGEYN